MHDDIASVALDRELGFCGWGISGEEAWRFLDVQLADWHVHLTIGEHEADFTADEFLDTCAAHELGREPAKLLAIATKLRAKGRRARMPWGDLVCGAIGLHSRDDAPGRMTLAECCKALGIDVIEIRWGKM